MTKSERNEFFEQLYALSERFSDVLDECNLPPLVEFQDLDREEFENDINDVDVVRLYELFHEVAAIVRANYD